VISPLLANVYLHYALDLWAVRWRRREATGDMIIVRYADDFIVGFQHVSDARRFLVEMRERLGKFALTLHPEKTRLIEFGRFAAERRQRRGHGKPETFNFLGFTFICGKTRSGKFQIKRKTRPDRMRAKLKMLKEEMWRRMHQPIPTQGKWLWYVVQGYFNYHAVHTNARTLDVFRHHVTDLWRRTLRRRSQKDRITWERMTKLVDDWLPKPRGLHPWPSERFAVTHPRWEPYAGKPHVEFVKRLFEQIDADVVEERGEPLLLPFLCDFPYAFQRLFHAYPVLRPARALLVRIPLGPRPSLHRLRCVRLCRCLHSGLIRFVRRLHCYYGGVRLLGSVHHRLRLLAFPMRTAVLDTAHATATARPETSQVPMRSLCT